MGMSSPFIVLAWHFYISVLPSHLWYHNYTEMLKVITPITWSLLFTKMPWIVHVSHVFIFFVMTLTNSTPRVTILSRIRLAFPAMYLACNDVISTDADVTCGNSPVFSFPQLLVTDVAVTWPCKPAWCISSNLHPHRKRVFRETSLLAKLDKSPYFGDSQLEWRHFLQFRSKRRILYLGGSRGFRKHLKTPF
jgi:hypothetical protein